MSGGGWQATLDLQLQPSRSRTRLARRRHRGPLLVQRAFYPEPAAPVGAAAAEPCHVYLIHPPGGAVSGDELQLEVEVLAQAHGLLTTPAAGKFYRRGPQRVARLHQRLRVDAGGVLEWLPQENIWYPGTAVELRTEVHLAGSARFFGWEIGCAGLPASDLSLADGSVRQSFELWLGDTPLLLERLALERAGLGACWGLAGYAALGSLLAYPAQAAQLQLARECAARANCADMMLACTLVDGVLSCRARGARADRLKQAFIELWCALRPALLGRRAIPPRIWAT